MEHTFDTYSVDRHSDSIVCAKCGNRGEVIWDDVSRLKNEEADLLGVDGSFLERIGHKPPYPIELVCRECGGVAVTVFPSTSLHDRREYN